MPIYAYACSNCGLQKDVMQKLSDTPLTICPECGKETLSKQLTAAGFQLKGSGYYATDFKNGSQPKPKPESESKSKSEPEPACAPCASASASASSCPIASDNA